MPQGFKAIQQKSNIHMFTKHICDNTSIIVKMFGNDTKSKVSQDISHILRNKVWSFTKCFTYFMLGKLDDALEAWGIEIR